MPNHIHLLILVKDGVPGSSRPTMLLPNIIAALKKKTNKEIGFDFWQTSYHDHIIREEEGYLNHLQYIDENSARWAQDEIMEGRIMPKSEKAIVTVLCMIYDGIKFYFKTE